MAESRVTLKKVNQRIAPLGYELLKGKGYFYFVPLDTDKNPHLYDSMVCTFLLSDNSVDDWESILNDRIAETF